MDKLILTDNMTAYCTPYKNFKVFNGVTYIGSVDYIEDKKENFAWIFNHHSTGMSATSKERIYGITLRVAENGFVVATPNDPEEDEVPSMLNSPIPFTDTNDSYLHSVLKLCQLVNRPGINLSRPYKLL